VKVSFATRLSEAVIFATSESFSVLIYSFFSDEATSSLIDSAAFFSIVLSFSISD
jgi:hypothetical protein